MPNAVKVVLFLLRECGHHAKFRKQFVEDHAMQIIELGPRKLAFSDLLHRWRITCSPPICKARPIDVHAFRFAPGSTLRNDGTAPIDDCTERVEDQSLRRHDWFRLSDAR